jgi:predicted RNA-binding Zn ribbon-like protein
MDTVDRLGLVQAFASTHSYRGHEDDLRDSVSATAWLRSINVKENTPVDDLDRMRSLRDFVRTLIADHRPAAVDQLNELVAASAVTARIDPGLSEVEHITPLDTLESQIATAIVDVIARGHWSRLRLCANTDECGVAFYDRSRNRQGRWCSAAICGNRINSRSHRRRVRDSSAVA